MKIALTVAAISAIAATLIGGPAAAQSAPERLRGPLPDNLSKFVRQASPVQVATCPAHFHAVFANKKLSCEKHILQVSDAKCPPAFPTFTARTDPRGHDRRDLCSKSGVNISSDGDVNPRNFREDIDFVLLPGGGVRNRVSFVAADANAAIDDGWRLNTSNSDGITDRYERTLVLKATPVLVNP